MCRYRNYVPLQKSRDNRSSGCFIGLAIGDTLGAAVEFQPPGTFDPVTGYRAGGPYNLKAGEWTDDTSMALALADSIASIGWDLNDQARRYLAWYRCGQYSLKCLLEHLSRNERESSKERFGYEHVEESNEHCVCAGGGGSDE